MRRPRLNGGPTSNVKSKAGLKHSHDVADVGHSNDRLQTQLKSAAPGAEQGRFIQVANSSCAVTGAASRSRRAMVAAAVSKSSALASVSEPPTESASVRTVEQRTLSWGPHPLSHSPNQVKRSHAPPPWPPSALGKLGSSISPAVTAPSLSSP
jgi:hypothetical protein